MADDDLTSELEQLRAENERLKNRQTRGVSLKVGEKAGPRVASHCGDSADRESDSVKSSTIDDQKNSFDAPVCRSEPRLGVSRGQGKGNAKSG